MRDPAHEGAVPLPHVSWLVMVAAEAHPPLSESKSTDWSSVLDGAMRQLRLLISRTFEIGVQLHNSCFLTSRKAPEVPWTRMPL